MQWHNFSAVRKVLSYPRMACLILLFGLSTLNAAAVLQIRIDSPAANAQVNPGETLTVTVSASGSVAGFESIVVSFGEDSWTQRYDAYPPTMDATESFDFVVPNGASGQTLTITARVNDYVDEPATAYRDVVLSGPDTAAPTYSGAAGVISATRLAGNTTATVTWHQAQDNVTAAGAMVYNVYLGGTAANPFAGTVKASFTGVLSGTISGLDPAATYYVGVRAKDEAGNEELNTQKVMLAPLPNAAKAGWTLYE